MKGLRKSYLLWEMRRFFALPRETQEPAHPTSSPVQSYPFPGGWGTQPEMSRSPTPNLLISQKPRCVIKKTLALLRNPAGFRHSVRGGG